MGLVGGARIGAYEVVGALGAGGMGEVYRARDTRLDREVALKVLPDAAHTDPDRTGRVQLWIHHLLPDGRGYAYSVNRRLATLFLVEGLR